MSVVIYTKVGNVCLTGIQLKEKFPDGPPGDFQKVQKARTIAEQYSCKKEDHPNARLCYNMNDETFTVDWCCGESKYRYLQSGDKSFQQGPWPCTPFSL